jgi:R3H domain/G-patch domain
VSGGLLGQDDPIRQENSKDVGTERGESAAEESEGLPFTGPEEVNQETHLESDKAVGIQSIETEISITKQVELLNLSAASHKPLNTARRSSSISSTSSGEVILFTGRGNPPNKRKESSTPQVPQPGISAPVNPCHAAKSLSPTRLPPDIPSKLKPNAAEFIPAQSSNPTHRYPLRSRNSVTAAEGSQKRKGLVNPAGRQSTKGSSRTAQRTWLDNHDNEEEILQDYIENMKKNQESDDEASSDDVNRPSKHIGSDLANDKDIPAGAPSAAQSKGHNASPENQWSSDDLRDFDAIDTSDDELIDIGGVFSRRVRPSGLQYLVTSTGQSTDFAKWILHGRLTSAKAKELVIAFEESHIEGPAGSEDDDNRWEDSESQDSEERALKDIIRDHESEHNENERILARTARMSDAELARVLNKQAELGIDADDIVLFDGATEEPEDFIPFSTKTHISNRTRSKQSRRSKNTFPSAEAFADALDEDPQNAFDFMDFDRPSLKPKRKGRKSATGLPFELEDDELADQLAESWANDRSKKATRKAEREQLRQAGLLGAKTGHGDRVDLQTKYEHSGMDMDQVKAEIRLFLIDDDREALALAPMDSPQRAQVHLLAKALYLTSHSQGKGDRRFPILTKTAFSGHYDEDSIAQIDALMAMRKFSTPWGKREKMTRDNGRKGAIYGGGGGGGAKPRRGGGGGVAAGATYMDGDVVGASAPELGSENRGRAMLEKMGWSAGMGIGKVGNKGRVEVIQHVVKNSKAGLG